MERSDLPFGSEFSPSQVSLRHLLELAVQHGGNWRALEVAVRESYFEKNKTSDYNKGKLANNTKLGMIAYGLIDRDANLTELGHSLYEIRQNEGKLYQTFALHILKNLNGMNFVQCVLDIQAAGETVDLIKLREWLEERGIHHPRGGKHPSMMRLWLEKAGVFIDGWRVNEIRLKEVLGVSVKEFEALAVLSPEQKAFVKALVNLAGKGPYQSNEVEKLATATYGIKFNEKNLPKQVLYPLQEAGYITLERGTKGDGRGAKPFFVVPTEKLEADIVTPLLAQIEQQVQSDLRPLLRKSLAEILKDVKSADRHVCGLALEVLAFKLMRLVDLQYVATRLRGASTGGAEVDVVFEGARLVFSRWQVQCKNTDRVSLDDVAKEVGLTHFLKSNVIVIVTTGEVGPEARRYSNKIMTDSNLCIVIVNGSDLDVIKDNPIYFVDVLKREAEYAMKIKKLEL